MGRRRADSQNRNEVCRRERGRFPETRCSLRKGLGYTGESVKGSPTSSDTTTVSRPLCETRGVTIVVRTRPRDLSRSLVSHSGPGGARIGSEG